MSSVIEIPLIFCNLTMYLNDTDAIKLSRINKYSYSSLAQYVNLIECFTIEELKKK
jgi:hypothetical protein